MKPKKEKNKKEALKYTDIRSLLEWGWFFLCIIFIGLNSTIWLFSIAIFVFMSATNWLATKTIEHTVNGGPKFQMAVNAIGLLVGSLITLVVQYFALWFNAISRSITDNYANGAEVLNVDLTKAPIDTIIKVSTETFIDAPFLVGTHVVAFALLSYFIPRLGACLYMAMEK